MSGTKFSHCDLDFDLYDSKTLSTSCPEQNFCTVARRIIKLGTWMPHGKEIRHIPNLGHCDLDFDL